MTDAQAIDHDFTCVLEGDMGPNKWTCAIMPGSQDFFGTGKAVKVVAAIGGQAFEATMLPHKGGHMLPLKKSLQTALGKAAGDTVTVHLSERLS